MLLTRLLSGLLATAALLLAGCEAAPEYPDEPTIEFKEIRAERGAVSAPGETGFNRIFVTIKYQDGNGDLGLSEEDKKMPPFTTAPYNFNYYAKMYVYNSTTRQFEPDLSFNGTFARLLTDPNAKPQPIRGDLVYEVNKGNGFPINYPQYRPGNRVKFDIYIYDRGEHKSNVITTDEYVLP